MSGKQLGEDGCRSILVDEVIRVVDEGDLSLGPCFAALASSLSFCFFGCKSGSSLVWSQDLGTTGKRFSFIEPQDEEVTPPGAEGPNVCTHWVRWADVFAVQAFATRGFSVQWATVTGRMCGIHALPSIER